jgi:hypothetical protein
MGPPHSGASCRCNIRGGGGRGAGGGGGARGCGVACCGWSCGHSGAPMRFDTVRPYGSGYRLRSFGAGSAGLGNSRVGIGSKASGCQSGGSESGGVASGKGSSSVARVVSTVLGVWEVSNGAARRRTRVTRPSPIAIRSAVFHGPVQLPQRLPAGAAVEGASGSADPDPDLAWFRRTATRAS